MRELRKCGTAAGMVLVWLTASASGQAADPFDAALEAAKNYPVQYYQSGSLEHSVALFDKVLANFPDHPRRLEAEYEEFQRLACSIEQKHLAHADTLIRDVVGHADVKSALGRDARLALVRFQISEAPHERYEDLKLAEKCLAEVLAVTDAESPEMARWVAHRAALYRREEKNNDALQALVDYLGQLYGKPNFWVHLEHGDPDRHRAFQDACVEVHNQLMAAIGHAKGVEASKILRNARAAPWLAVDQDFWPEWEKYEESQVLKEGETFHDVVAEVFARATKEAERSPATRPAPAPFVDTGPEP